MAATATRRRGRWWAIRVCRHLQGEIKTYFGKKYDKPPRSIAGLLVARPIRIGDARSFLLFRIFYGEPAAPLIKARAGFRRKMPEGKPAMKRHSRKSTRS